MATRARRAPRTEDRPALRVVAGRGGRSFRVAMVPAAVVLVLAIFAVAALQAYLAQEGFRAAKLERDLRHEEERFALLRAEVAGLSSPARLESVAREHGLTEPAEPVFLRAPVEVPESADEAPAPYAAKRLLSELR